MGLWCGDGLGISQVQVVTTLDHTTSYCIMQNCRVAEILQMQDILAHCEACVQDIALILQV